MLYKIKWTKHTISHCASHRPIVAYFIVAECLIALIVQQLTYNYSLLLLFFNTRHDTIFARTMLTILLCLDSLVSRFLYKQLAPFAHQTKHHERDIETLTYNWKCRKMDKTFGTATGNRLSKVCRYTSSSFCLFSTRVLEFLPIIFLGGSRCLSIFFSEVSWKTRKPYNTSNTANHHDTNERRPHLSII